MNIQSPDDCVYSSGGKLKGSSVQYHQNIKPELGKSLYTQFCQELTEGAKAEVRKYLRD